MRAYLLYALLSAPIGLMAQYGSFDAAAVKASKATTLTVVLDPGDSPFNRTIMEAVKGNWTLHASLDFITAADLGAQPMTPEKTYLMKTTKVDPVKFEGTFLSVVKGWKQRKGESFQFKEYAFTGVPAEQELAFIMIDQKALGEGRNAAMLTVYVKHLQDYLKQVEAGRIIDKATADRLYASRTRLIRDTELHIAQEHLDKSLPDLNKVQESYTAPVQIGSLAQVMERVSAQDSGSTVTDVLLTGEYKTKHCFKRIFNAGTGELMYLGDDAALAGKKEGIIAQDLLNVMRAR
ncbi:MAG: hypothetical protein QY325_11280 [Flavobacteriales bacterium]|nr:MAG: hypothetical protein QY325_11280 [Flavobacteriales bacterium]